MQDKTLTFKSKGWKIYESEQMERERQLEH